MNETEFKPKFGWLPDYPDIRDFTVKTRDSHPRLSRINQPPINQMLARAGIISPVAAPPSRLPTLVDLRQWCSPIENQGALGSCTANAAAGLVEFFERKAFGKHIDVSRIFLYKATRNLMKVTGDTGAYLRTTLQALVMFGVPPESYWAYNVATFDNEPTAFIYSMAQSFQTLSYYRLNPPGTAYTEVLNQVKIAVANGLPPMFGLSLYSSYTQANTTGCIPFPTSSEAMVGGHALVVVGYDDTKKIVNTNTGGIETTGALLVRNSWGTSWGSSGYGWLPYQYVLSGLTGDWWSIISNEWLNTGQFAVPPT